jgi:hypothetical protein
MNIDDKIYFLASTFGSSMPSGLIRIKTSFGNPHIGFSTIELANKCIESKRQGKVCIALSDLDVTPDIRFDMSYGVVVIENDDELSRYLSDPDSFNYSAKLKMPKLPVVSKNPW